MGGDARTVTDLHLRDDQLYVGSASRDVVTTLYGQLGDDPSLSTASGAHALGRKTWRRAAFRGSRTDHSLYYDDATDSESLYAMAEIVTGQGDQLGAHDMIAEGRHTVTFMTDRGPVSADMDPRTCARRRQDTSIDTP